MQSLETFLSDSVETSAIKPTDIVRINDLHLVAKRIANGYLQGLQSSQQRGLGIEFNQYRSYEVGDELSRIDWKLFARSDRYFVREAERESEIDVWFLLDTSRSMLQNCHSVSGEHSKEKKLKTKFEYAKVLIASLSFLVQNQGDEFGFVGLSSDALSFIPKGNGQTHWHKLLIALNDVQVGQYFPPVEMLKNHLSQLNKPSIIFFISDFYQQNNEIYQLLSKFNSSRSEVVALQLRSNKDIDLDIDKHSNDMVKFKDVETLEERMISAKQAKKYYSKSYSDHITNLTKKLNNLGIELTTIDVEKDMESTINQFLNKRASKR